MSKRVRTRRRAFVVDSSYFAAAWLGVQLPWLGVLSACARDDARIGAPFAHLSAAEARAMHAFAAHLIPPGEDVGAAEAAVVHFVDRAVGLGYFANDMPVLRAGLADLDARALATGAASFASLAHEAQLRIMQQINRSSFFTTARTLIVMGTFGSGRATGVVHWDKKGGNAASSHVPL